MKSAYEGVATVLNFKAEYKVDLDVCVLCLFQHGSSSFYISFLILISYNFFLISTIFPVSFTIVKIKISLYGCSFEARIVFNVVATFNKSSITCPCIEFLNSYY